MKRVALYTRVSTEDQAKEGFSLGAQLDRLRSYAEAQHWEITGEYVDDGHSGRTTQRPAYQEMMRERDKWDTLLVLKMDRIHRNSRNFMGMMDSLEQHSKGFASVMESLDTSTAMGRFVMDIIQRIAQLESEQIGERVLTGMKQKAKENPRAWMTRVPYGYRIGRRGYLVRCAETAPVVQDLFQAYAEGMSGYSLVQALNDADILTNAGKKWTSGAVHKILRNRTYLGERSWAGVVTEDAHEALIPDALFNDVQKRSQAKRDESWAKGNPKSRSMPTDDITNQVEA